MPPGAFRRHLPLFKAGPPGLNRQSEPDGALTRAAIFHPPRISVKAREPIACPERGAKKQKKKKKKGVATGDRQRRRLFLPPQQFTLRSSLQLRNPRWGETDALSGILPQGTRSKPPSTNRPPAAVSVADYGSNPASRIQTSLSRRPLPSRPTVNPMGCPLLPQPRPRLRDGLGLPPKESLATRCNLPCVHAKNRIPRLSPRCPRSAPGRAAAELPRSRLPGKPSVAPVPPFAAEPRRACLTPSAARWACVFDPTVAPAPEGTILPLPLSTSAELAEPCLDSQTLVLRRSRTG